MKRVFISTTNHIDNGKAVAYHGVVSSHLVAGTGFLSDFAASLTDIFGGRSNSYRRQMEDLYSEALDEVSEKAQLLGANAVLGLKIDMDNISGKGMSMFMITATGTAATVEFDSKEQEEGVVSSTSVTSAMLAYEVTKRGILEQLNSDRNRISSNTWDFMLKNPDSAFVEPLTRRFFEMIAHFQSYDSIYREQCVKNFSQFLQIADRSLAIGQIYEAIYQDETRNEARQLIKEQHLFNAKSVLKLIKNGMVRSAVDVLNVEQPSYNETDLHDMEEIINAFENLPDLGKIEIVKGGMFSKDSEKYICRHGHKNDPDSEYCSDCQENIKGLTWNDLEDIETFKKRVAVLKELLSR